VLLLSDAGEPNAEQSLNLPCQALPVTVRSHAVSSTTYTPSELQEKMALMSISSAAWDESAEVIQAQKELWSSQTSPASQLWLKAQAWQSHCWHKALRQAQPQARQVKRERPTQLVASAVPAEHM
jgi:hypothetical protein